jgi:hypothetical protein
MGLICPCKPWAACEEGGSRNTCKLSNKSFAGSLQRNQDHFKGITPLVYLGIQKIFVL